MHIIATMAQFFLARSPPGLWNYVPETSGGSNEQDITLLDIELLACVFLQNWFSSQNQHALNLQFGGLFDDTLKDV